MSIESKRNFVFNFVSFTDIAKYLRNPMKQTKQLPGLCWTVFSADIQIKCAPCTPIDRHMQNQALAQLGLYALSILQWQK